MRTFLLLGAASIMASCTGQYSGPATASGAHSLASAAQLAAGSSPYALSNAMTSTAPSNTAIDTRAGPASEFLASTAPDASHQPLPWYLEPVILSDFNRAPAFQGGGQ